MSRGLAVETSSVAFDRSQPTFYVMSKVLNKHYAKPRVAVILQGICNKTVMVVYIIVKTHTNTRAYKRHEQKY